MRVERSKLGDSGDDSEWAQEDKNQSGLEAGGVHEGKKMDVSHLVECKFEYGVKAKDRWSTVPE